MAEQPIQENSDSFWNKLGVIFLERLTSPLISTFIISWSVTNYKVFLIVLGKADLQEKLTRLDAYFAGATISIPSAVWVYGVPLLATLFYIFVYPHINLKVMEVVDENNRKLKTQQELGQYKKVVDELRGEKVLLEKELNSANENVAALQTSLSDLTLEYDKQSVDMQLLKSKLGTTENKLKEVSDAFDNLSTSILEDDHTSYVEQKILEQLWSDDNNLTSIDGELLGELVQKKGDITNQQYLDAIARLRLQQLIHVQTEPDHDVITITARAKNDAKWINLMPRPRRL